MLWIRKSRLVCDMVSQVHMKVGSFILHYIQKSRLVCNWAFQKVGSNILHCGFTSPDLSAAWYLKKVGNFILRCGFTSQELSSIWHQHAWTIKKNSQQNLGSFILRCGFTNQDLNATWYLKYLKYIWHISSNASWVPLFWEYFYLSLFLFLVLIYFIFKIGF